MTKHSEPLFRVVKRDSLPLWKSCLIYVVAIAISLILGAVLLATLSVNPLDFYKQMITLGAIGNKFAYKAYEGFIKLFVPLLLTSIGLSLAFKMRFWNIGGEGQFIFGALAAGAVALNVGPDMPAGVVLLLTALAGGVAGGLYGLIPAVFKVKFGTNETLMTLMLNYIALYVLQFFGETQGTWNVFLSTESVRPRFATFADNAKMPTIPMGNFSLNISLIIAIVITALIFVYLKHSKQGYEISVVGDSESTAHYAGMKVGKIILRTMFLSAFLIGLSGAFSVSSAHTLSTSITNDVGWTGIIVVWLSKLSPPAIFVTSILISVLQYGCRNAGASFAVIDANFADLLQGIILFAVLAADFFIRFKLVFRKKEVVK